MYLYNIYLLLVGIPCVSVKGECIDIANCEECTNPDLICQQCEDGKLLGLDGLICEDCPAGCKSCSRGLNEEVTCVECLNGYSKDSDSASCINCGTNCEECDSIGNCKNCEDTYVLENNKCARCPENCASCPDTLTCSTCELGFYKTVDGQLTVCKACIDNCVECESQICTKCKTGYTLKEGQCFACPWKCSDCTSTSEAAIICTQCEEGYGYKTHNTCDSCPDDCLSCDSTDCLTCADGYTISTDATGYYRCSVCPSNCEECLYDEAEGIGNCVTCSDLHVLNPANGQCQACDENCVGDCRWETQYEYSPVPTFTAVVITVNGPVCGECTGGFGVSQLGHCLPCPDNCLGCFDNSDDPNTPAMVCGHTCLLHYECGDDLLCQYFRQADRENTAPDRKYDFTENVIRAGPTGPPGPPEPPAPTEPPGRTRPGAERKKRSGEEATVLPIDATHEPTNPQPCCKAGYYNLEDGGECLPCIDNCRYCQSSTECIVCKYGFDLVNTKCTAICPKHCHFCDSTGQCTECDPMVRMGDFGNTHYVEIYPHNYICYACPRNCEASLESYIQSNDALRQCVFNQDLDDTVCKSSQFCRPGTALTPVGQCKECDNPDCNRCQWVIKDGIYKSDCLECNDLFAVDSSRECRACPDRCLECLYNAIKNTVECKQGQCEEGFTRHPDRGLCTSCGNKCTGCSIDSNSNMYCSVCGTGFVLHPTQYYCLECPNQCSKCEFDNNNLLRCSGSQYCTPGYSVAVDGNCQACPPNSEKCYAHESGAMYAELCFPYFYRNQGQCGVCPDGCARCIDQEGTMQCTECYAGHVLSQRLKACLKCPSNCELCVESNGIAECETCKETFHLIDGQCVSCSDLYFTHCGECTLYDGECTACMEGYTLSDDGASCIPCSQSTPGCSTCLDEAVKCTICSGDLIELSNGQCGYNCYACNGTDGCEIPGMNRTDVDTEPCPADLYQCAVRTREETNSTKSYERMCLEISECPDEPLCLKQKSGNEHQTECLACCTGELCNVNSSPPMSATIIGWITCLVYLLFIQCHFIPYIVESEN